MKKIYTFVFSIFLFSGMTYAQTWTAINTGLGALTTKGLAVSDDTLFTAVAGQGVYYSVDFGGTWQTWWGNPQVANNNVNSFYGADVGGLGQEAFFYGLGQGLMFYFESNNGLFSLPISNLPNQNIRCFTKVDNPGVSLFGTDQGVYHSESANTFNLSSGFSGNSLVINSIFEDEDTVFAGTNEGLYFSLDFGQSFSISNIGIPPNIRINKVGLFTLTSNGIYLLGDYTLATPFITSGDYRTSFINYASFDSYFFGDNVAKKVNLQNPLDIQDIPLDGITGGTIIGTTLKGDYLFVCTETGGVFRTLLSTLTSTISQNVNSSIVIQPNPNNGSFNVSIPQEENSIIQIFDVTGREIQTLKNTSNSLITQVDLTNHSNGIYFVKIIGNNGSFKSEKIVVEK